MLASEVEWNLRAGGTFLVGPTKLHLDFDAGFALARDMGDDVLDRHMLVRSLFALSGQRLEQAAADAARGEAAHIDRDTQRDLANRLHSHGEELTVLSDAIRAIGCEAA